MAQFGVLDEKAGVVIVRLVGAFFIFFALVGSVLLLAFPYLQSLQH